MLMNIEWIGSPNFDKGRGGKKPSQIVIHWFGSKNSTLKSTDNYFQKKYDPTTKTGGTSANFGVEDNVIHQYVNTDDTSFAVGIYERNQETISIEHSANLARDASAETLETSAQLIAMLCKKYNISPSDQTIIKHSSIKATQCPGTIPIDWLITRTKQLLKGEQPPMAGLTDREYRDLYYTELGTNGVVSIAGKFGDKPPEGWGDNKEVLKSFVVGVNAKVSLALKKQEEDRIELNKVNTKLIEALQERAEYQVQNERYAETILTLNRDVDELTRALEAAQETTKFDWQRFTSRKFLLALLAVLIPLVNQAFNLNLSLETIITMIAPLLAFVGVEGWADIKQSGVANTKKVDK